MAHTSNTKEPFGDILDMMEAVKSLWDLESPPTVTRIAKRVASRPNNKAILKADGWTEADFVNACVYRM